MAVYLPVPPVQLLSSLVLLYVQRILCQTASLQNPRHPRFCHKKLDKNEILFIIKGQDQEDISGMKIKDDFKSMRVPKYISGLESFITEFYSCLTTSEKSTRDT